MTLHEHAPSEITAEARYFVSSYYFDYLLCLPFKGPCLITLGIYFR